jgi:hypothetical protein
MEVVMLSNLETASALEATTGACFNATQQDDIGIAKNPLDKQVKRVLLQEFGSSRHQKLLSSNWLLQLVSQKLA